MSDDPPNPQRNPYPPFPRSGHRLFHRPSPQKQIPSNQKKNPAGEAPVGVGVAISARCEPVGPLLARLEANRFFKGGPLNAPSAFHKQPCGPNQ